MSFTDGFKSLFSASRAGALPFPPAVSSKTRVMPRSSSSPKNVFASGAVEECERPVASRSSSAAAMGVLPWEANVTLLFDASKSMPQSALDYVFGKGIETIFSALSATQACAGYQYNVRIATFSTDVVEIIPFTPLEKAKRMALAAPEAQGVTLIEDALRDAFDKTDALKREQDSAFPRRPRVGSLVVVVTDGRPTDADGNLRPLSRELVREIAERNETRKTTTFAIGMGQAHDGILKDIGPTSFSFDQGSYREIPHAIRYKGDTYDDTECWRAACDIIGGASSSRSGAPTIVYRGSCHPCASEDVVEIDPERYAIVR